MSQIKVSNLTFAYEGSYGNIFENVSFVIDTDWKLGLTGRNGRGKTTFLNLLCGKYEYSGKIISDTVFEYFPFEVGNVKADTVQVIEGIFPDYIDWEMKRELALLEINEDVLNRPFETLSLGERTKVLLATLFLKKNRFLLIDEPTDHLDMHARSILGEYLNAKKSFILVSHDRSLLDKSVDHILSINKSNIEIQKGNFSTWLKNKEMQDNFELAENEKLRKDIERLSQAAKRTADWADRAEAKKIGFDPYKTEKQKSHRPYVAKKAKKLMKQAKAIQQRQQTAIEDKSMLLKNIESTEKLRIQQIPYFKKLLAEFDDVSILYGDKTVCKDLSFSIERGDRIALCGKNGSGKTSIIKLLCGEQITYTGAFRKGGHLGISYITQDTSWLEGNLKEFARNNSIDESLFKAILRKLDFSRAQFDKDMRVFSSGQKKKVLIAKSLCESSNLYVWDEPLNFVDVLSRMQLEELLLQFEPTILFVEHDKTFCENIATKVIGV